MLKILNTSSPIRQAGNIFHAHTEWRVNDYFHWFERQDGRCRITDVSVELSGVINLPKLINATPDQQSKFNAYLTALRIHELGHFNIGKRAAIAIDEGISALPEMNNCRELDSTANDLANRILKDFQAREIQYDASTGHGKTQGAWLDRN